MTVLIGYCLVLFIVTYLSIRLFITLSPKLGLVDIPNERSSHKKITPRGAGLVFGFAFLISVLIFNYSNFSEIKYTLLAIAIIYICGIVDDIYTISSKQKFSFIIVAAVIVFFNGYQITNIGTFFNIPISIGFLALPFTVFAIVGFTNALNLSDGLDGLAGSLALIILCALCAVGYIHDDTILLTWSAFLIAAVCAFLILNWYPAKVFMGDSGSLLLGFMISILSIKALDYVNPISILFLTALPIIDTMVVFRRRMQRGKSPFAPDKNHLHHILNNIKQDKAFTVRMLITIQLGFSCIFLQINQKDDVINLIVFILLFLIFFNLFDPRMKRRPENARIRKRYQKPKEE
jgi:UDP-GlcNAc:undecaprenyl-phosphate GlcNAc-1-phosphate transferase